LKSVYLFAGFLYRFALPQQQPQDKQETEYREYEPGKHEHEADVVTFRAFELHALEHHVPAVKEYDEYEEQQAEIHLDVHIDYCFVLNKGFRLYLGYILIRENVLISAILRPDARRAMETEMSRMDNGSMSILPLMRHGMSCISKPTTETSMKTAAKVRNVLVNNFTAILNKRDCRSIRSTVYFWSRIYINNLEFLYLLRFC